MRAVIAAPAFLAIAFLASLVGPGPGSTDAAVASPGPMGVPLVDPAEAAWAWSQAPSGTERSQGNLLVAKGSGSSSRGSGSRGGSKAANRGAAGYQSSGQAGYQAGQSGSKTPAQSIPNASPRLQSTPSPTPSGSAPNASNP